MLFNRPRAVAWLAECKLDAVIATSWVNVLYLTGYYLWLQPVFKAYMASPGAGDELGRLFATLTSDGLTSLVLDQNCELNGAEIPHSNRYVYGSAEPDDSAAAATAAVQLEGFVRTALRFPTPIEALVAAVNSAEKTHGRIGVEMSGLSATDQSNLAEALPDLTLLDAGNLLRLIRMVKSDQEVMRLRRSAEINELAASESLRLARPGCQMQELVAAYRSAAAREGADFDHFAFSQRGVGFATESSYRSAGRETMFVDFGCSFQHYLSDAGLTLAVGGLPDHECQSHQALVECIQTGAECLVPGRKASAVQAAMMKVLAQAKLSGCFAHGHGIGIELRDYPILVPDTGLAIRDDCVDLPADLPLENGMVINLEAPLFEHRGAAFQVEQSYLVTPKGGVPLTSRDLSSPRLALS